MWGLSYNYLNRSSFLKRFYTQRFKFGYSTLPLVESIAIVIGLVVFEVVNSVDNAAVNAAVLKTMSVLASVTFTLIGIAFYKSGQLIKLNQPKTTKQTPRTLEANTLPF